jgi:hypothetical protein
MKVLLRLYSASCLAITGFFCFFLIPVESLLFAPSVTAILVGGLLMALTGGYFARMFFSNTFEFGWFLANKHGFWVIIGICLGFMIFLSGLLMYIAPDAVEPAFERGAWPVAGMLVILFWFSLIFMFGFLSFSVVGQCVAFARIRRIKSAFGTLALAVVCLAMTTLFVSLFLEVVNDVFIRVSDSTQWAIIWLFAALVSLRELLMVLGGEMLVIES